MANNVSLIYGILKSTSQSKITKLALSSGWSRMYAEIYEIDEGFSEKEENYKL